MNKEYWCRTLETVKLQEAHYLSTGQVPEVCMETETLFMYATETVLWTTSCGAWKAVQKYAFLYMGYPK